MTTMTPKERAHYDAQADHEAWSFAHEIMLPWMEIVRSVGSGELEKVMQRAFSEVEREVGRTLDVLEDYQEGVEPAGSYRSVLQRISHHHGFSGAEEVARKAAQADPRHTAEELLESPAYGFGDALNGVLDMDEAERWRLSSAFARSFLSRNFSPNRQEKPNS